MPGDLDRAVFAYRGDDQFVAAEAGPYVGTPPIRPSVASRHATMFGSVLSHTGITTRGPSGRS